MESAVGKGIPFSQFGLLTIEVAGGEKVEEKESEVDTLSLLRNALYCEEYLFEVKMYSEAHTLAHF